LPGPAPVSARRWSAATGLEGLRPGPGPAREGLCRSGRRPVPAGPGAVGRSAGRALGEPMCRRTAFLRTGCNVRAAPGDGAAGARQQPRPPGCLPARPGPVRPRGRSMTGAGEMPRGALGWLLVAQLLVILPLVIHLPAWLALLWLGCATWRVQAYRMRVALPPAWLKPLLLLAVVLGLGLGLSSSGFNLNAASALLVATFILKVLEMHRQKDALVVLFLGFFALATGYLFESGLLAALYTLVPIAALLAALIGLQRSRLLETPAATLRLVGS